MLTTRFAPVLLLLALIASACGDDSEDTVLVAPPESSIADTPEEAPLDETPDLPANSPGVEAERTARFFADAVADGDEETASLFASPSVLEFFAPWEATPGAAFQSITDDTFFLILGPGHLVSCQLDGNLDVASCVDESEPEVPDESEPEVPDEETAELAYDDPAGYYLVEFVTPELGGFPETREGAIIRTLDAYVVDYEFCCTNDNLYASVSSVEDNAVFTIYGPDGEPVAVETMSANVVLQQGGEYWIVVGSTRGNATYTIEFGLAQDAS